MSLPSVVPRPYSSSSSSRKSCRLATEKCRPWSLYCDATFNTLSETAHITLEYNEIISVFIHYTYSPVSPVIGAFGVASIIQVIIRRQQVSLPQLIFIFFGQVWADSVTAQTCTDIRVRTFSTLRLKDFTTRARLRPWKTKLLTSAQIFTNPTWKLTSYGLITTQFACPEIRILSFNIIFWCILKQRKVQTQRIKALLRQTAFTLNLFIKHRNTITVIQMQKEILAVISSQIQRGKMLTCCLWWSGVNQWWKTSLCVEPRCPQTYWPTWEAWITGHPFGDKHVRELV